MQTPYKWDGRFVEMAKFVSTWSKDPSTQTGAVIVGPDNRIISTGFNGFPKGMPDRDELYANRDEKYSRIVHCEMNALLFASLPLPSSCTLYTYPFMSCDRCVVHMLQAGIREFVAPKCPADKAERWEPVFAKTRKYIEECKGMLVELDEE